MWIFLKYENSLSHMVSLERWLGIWQTFSFCESLICAVVVCNYSKGKSSLQWVVLPKTIQASFIEGLTFQIRKTPISPTMSCFSYSFLIKITQAIANQILQASYMCQQWNVSDNVISAGELKKKQQVHCSTLILSATSFMFAYYSPNGSRNSRNL